MKQNDGTSIFHKVILGRVLYGAMDYPETQGCGCLLCRHREKVVAREKARLLGIPPVV